MRFPDYPSNREANDGTNTTALGREGASEEEAKSGTRLRMKCPWDGVKLYDGPHRSFAALFLGCAVIFLLI